MTVELRFQPRLADTVWASFAGMRARPVTFYAALTIFGILPLALGILEWVRASTQAQPVAGSTIALIGIPVVMFGGAWLAPYLLLRNSPLMRGEHIHRYEAEGATFRGPSFENHMRWSAVTQATWIGGGLLLSNGKLLLAAIHPRLLTDETRGSLQSVLEQAGVAVKGRPMTKVARG